MGQIAISLKPGAVTFRDRNFDDRFAVEVMYALINDASRPGYR